MARHWAATRGGGGGAYFVLSAESFEWMAASSNFRSLCNLYQHAAEDRLFECRNIRLVQAFALLTKTRIGGKSRGDCGATRGKTAVKRGFTLLSHPFSLIVNVLNVLGLLLLRWYVSELSACVLLISGGLPVSSRGAP